MTVWPFTRNCFCASLDLELAGADDGWLAHLAADDRRMGRHPAGGRQNALRDEHAVDVVGHGLAPDEDHLLALIDPLDRVIG